jgi:hypothetical protein
VPSIVAFETALAREIGGRVAATDGRSFATEILISNAKKENNKSFEHVKNYGNVNVLGKIQYELLETE